MNNPFGGIFKWEYMQLLAILADSPFEEINNRTGVKIKLLPGGYSFKLDLSSRKVPLPCNRKVFPHIAAIETAWQFMGTKDATWINSKAPKLWSDFTEDDGTVSTAYGYRWQKHFNRNQIDLALKELKNNPTNRQLFISAWDPAIDGLGGVQPKNIPCPIGFTVSRHLDFIHISVFIRSSDVFVGLIYDVMNYALILDAFATSCNCYPGSLHITLGHAHIYENHFDLLKNSLENKSKWLSSSEESEMPMWSVQEIKEYPDLYIQKVRNLAAKMLDIPQQNPKVDIVI